MVYLFIGQDTLSKDIKIKNLKEESLARKIQDFNFDILYAKELTLKGLQEKLLFLPVKSLKRVIVIKDAENLAQGPKEFILKYAKKPDARIVLILDITRQDKAADFIKDIYKNAKIMRFKENPRIDTFTLNRSISMRKPDYALCVLDQLLKEGERPERILGGLRYAWEKDATGRPQARKRFKLLLSCDLEIKTGKLKPVFALEKLVVSLCSLT